MNKINRFLLIYMLVITGLCGYMYYVAFYRKDMEKEKLIHQVQSTITQQEKEEKKIEKKAKTTYGLDVRDGNLVVINNQTKEVFEYTDLKKDELPQDVLKLLKGKKIFRTREEVYHFLESCSS
ncbi:MULTISPECIES: hypothetical protein [Anaerostipes]|uniref:hypothetical protein n=1 Tax=Anaerostipes TaxID=207244 RepID=UPI0009527766|nr:MULTISPECIES: hypothetical protein [Anaerostipes]MCI5623015.1 hypothetical protein [Anaerostipes sp.]MDY2725712.1 hypothetical protein [Anaerostipes faecalis]OLR58578.1 hypothetical protein BHF70_02425 [Anaerostipes sp. 494a]